MNRPTKKQKQYVINKIHDYSPDERYSEDEIVYFGLPPEKCDVFIVEQPSRNGDSPHVYCGNYDGENFYAWYITSSGIGHQMNVHEDDLLCWIKIHR